MRIAKHHRAWSARVAAIVLAALVGARPAGAGTVILSADSNPIPALNGSFGVSPNDNAVFFRNVLGSGNRVGISIGSALAGDDSILNNYYNSLAGVSSSTLSGPLTSSALAGLSTLFVILPDNTFSASETAAVQGFLGAGKTVFFVGENGSFQSSTVNGDLSSIGSSMRLVPAIVDGGTPVATIANHQIVPDPLTIGVGTFAYGGLGTSLVSGGQALFLSSDRVTPFIAVERPAAGAVPEPSSLVLMGLGGLAVLGCRRLGMDRPANPSARP